MTDMLAGSPRVRHDASLLSDTDIFLFNEGTHNQLFDKLGAHLQTIGGADGVQFAVWAPDAESVSVIGDFNNWDTGRHPLGARSASGIWEGFIPAIGQGTIYKYHIRSRLNTYTVDKADPFGILHEHPPRTASVVWDLDYVWGDSGWMADRARNNALNAPWSIYEVHLGSWMRVPEDGNRWLSYRELAERLVDYVQRMGFTHVELLPIMEHPFYGSWGYQATGFFAPTSRYGTPQDFMALIDALHQANIGVILDWVPSHFPSDEHGLAYFDGTHLFEHADPRQGFHPDWGSAIFNYGRNEVRSFLLSSARFWLDRYHIDSLRVDAVASMLYLDYSRQSGAWVPNQFGGRENLDAISFLRRLNADTYQLHPDTQTIAEELTSWPMVSRPVYIGGLGFGMKWDMGWMHDTLVYMSRDAIHRQYHHNLLTFRLLYAFWENFVLSLSHDEVVHGKGSLINKMPGDVWQKFANLRVLYGYMFAQSGKKLLFMGCEIAQWREWNHDSSLDWHLLDNPAHAGIQRWVADLNRVYRAETALHEMDFEAGGFEWIDVNDTQQSVISLLRRDRSGSMVLTVFNFTPVPRDTYRVGVPASGFWRELLNSDAGEYGGSGLGNLGGVVSIDEPMHGRPYSLRMVLPPLAAVFFKYDG